MIAIRNMKLLADLTEQKEVLKEKYEKLLEQKEPELQKVLQTLMDDIKNYLTEKGLRVVEKNSSFSKGFVANYKSVYLRGEIGINENELKIYFQGDEINRFKVIPVPCEYHGNSEVPINDDLRNEIENLNHEVKSLNELIAGLESNKYCYMDTINSNVKYENNDKVIKNILK